MCLLQAKLIKGALEAALTKLKAYFQGKATNPCGAEDSAACACSLGLPACRQQEYTGVIIHACLVSGSAALMQHVLASCESFHATDNLYCSHWECEKQCQMSRHE